MTSIKIIKVKLTFHTTTANIFQNAFVAYNVSACESSETTLNHSASEHFTICRSLERADVTFFIVAV